MASHPDSAWSDAPRRSAASVSAIASRTSVPSVRPRAARTVAPAFAPGSSTAPLRRASDAATNSRPGIGVTTTFSPLASCVRNVSGKS